MAGRWPELLPRDIAGRGLGVLTRRAFRPGDVVLVLAGRPAAVPGAAAWLEVGPGSWIDPDGDLEAAVRHACRPTCGLVAEQGGLVLRALRRIRYGEEVTLDYATWRSVPPLADRCRCGVAECRGRIGAFGLLPAEQRAHYAALGVVPKFLAAAP